MDRHALLIGIDQYPLLRRFGPNGQLSGQDLRGCVNDAELMAALLRDRFGFPAANLTLLRNQRATRDGILGGLADLLRRSAPGDLVVLYYAGHGSQMRDREGTKPGGWDETLVPYDSGREEQPNRDITDDELRLWLLRLSERTPYVTLIFDCCHSATSHRDFHTISGERGLERDVRALQELPPSPLTPEQLEQLGPPREPATAAWVPSRWLPSSSQYVMLAGCRASETAKEHALTTSAPPVYHGALTYFLIEQIRKSAAGATYRDVFAPAAREVNKLYTQQHPAAEGALDRELFATRDTAAPPYFVVTRVHGSTVWIDGGAPQGVQVGSEWALFPPDTSALQVDDHEPRLRITAVSALGAEGQLVAGAAAIAEYWRAVLAQRPTELLWPIALVGVPDPDPAQPALTDNARVPELHITTLLTKSPWLRLIKEGETPRARVYLLAPRAEVAATDPVPQVGTLTSRTWAVLDGDGELLMKPLLLHANQRLADNLEKLARREFVCALENPLSRLAGRVDLQLLGQRAAGQWTPLHADAAALPTVPTGTRLVIDLKSCHDEPLYVALLQLDADGTLTQIYPPLGTSEPLRAGGTSRIGDREGHPIYVKFPADLPPLRNGQPARVARCGFKLLVTTQPLDLRALVQTAVRAAPPAQDNERNARRPTVTTLVPGDDWATAVRWLQISPTR